MAANTALNYFERTKTPSVLETYITALFAVTVAVWQTESSVSEAESVWISYLEVRARLTKTIEVLPPEQYDTGGSSSYGIPSLQHRVRPPNSHTRCVQIH